MKRVLMFFAVALFAVVVSAAAQAQTNPLVGTWKLDVTKSKFDPGPAPKSMTRTVAAQGDGVKYTFDGVAADGKPIAFSFAVNFDGKDNVITGSMPEGADTISAKRIDANTYEATTKKGGKVLGTAKVAVSKDGKTTTVETTGVTAAGVKTHDVQIYDKQ